MDQREKIALPKAMLFDMDGTLTQPFLDFPQIKQELGIDFSEAILEAMTKMAPERLAIAQRIVHEHEERAAEQSTLNDGCEDLLQWVRGNGIEIGLVTRNTRKSVDTVFGKHGIQIDVVVTREDGVYKPAPDPLYLACQKLGVRVDDSWMIGDGPHDIGAAEAASMRSIWISHDRQRDFPSVPTHICRDLLELHAFLKSCDNRRD